MARTAAELTAIRAELDTDPLGRGYSGMADGVAKNNMNTVIDRTRVKASMTAEEILGSVDTVEYAALADLNRDAFGLVMTAAGDGGVDPADGQPAANVVVLAFGGGSTTVTNLASARNESVSRGVELGWGRVYINDIADARALP